jgi:hypothetical protein
MKFMLEMLPNFLILIGFIVKIEFSKISKNLVFFFQVFEVFANSFNNFTCNIYCILVCRDAYSTAPFLVTGPNFQKFVSGPTRVDPSVIDIHAYIF